VSRSPDRRRRSTALAALLGLAAVLGLVAAGCIPPRPTPSPSASFASLPSPSVPTALATPLATPAIECTPEQAEVVAALRGDPCPGAITAVELATAPVRLPITRLVIEPGPFFCDNVWPGAGSPPICYGVLVIPGQYMHAWVAFKGSEAVAAVMLGRDLPPDLDSPVASTLPWNATLVTVEVPPDGWVMS
jgi:hypothetical protein